VISDHKTSAVYQAAEIADEYYAGRNVTINNYQKFIRDAYGKAIPDIWSPNHKIACHYYRYLVTQLALYLLGNGVSFAEDSTKEKLGGDFDENCVEALIDALNDGVAFAFVNKDRIQPFSVTEFAPLMDEETSAIRAGVRYWRLDDQKPLRATLYEEDGYTEYIQQSGEDMTVLHDKRPYIQIVAKSKATGEEIVDGQNYPTFPIVPLYNTGKRSELDGNRELHDAMDLMLSGLINNVDSGEVIYWLFKNAGGMDQPSLNQAIQLLKTAHAIQVDNEDDITAHSPQVHFEASKEALEQLRRQIFDNHMGLDVRNIAGGAATATQIKAAYEPINTKADLLEMQVVKFIRGVLAVLGIDDKPTFTRSVIVNQQELIQNIVSAGSDLPQEYKSRKILEILGDIDRADEVLAQLTAEDAGRFTTEPTETEND
jgi:SPP1 family phage portal protein